MLALENSTSLRRVLKSCTQPGLFSAFTCLVLCNQQRQNNQGLSKEKKTANLNTAGSF